MPQIQSLEPAIDPNNRIAFLLDWEITMKCNLDCSYCVTGMYGGHDNSLPHPPVDECLKTLDFLFEYVDLYMEKKPNGLKYVILNIYGGESLNHPDIIKILEQVRLKHQPYTDRWHLTVTTTTNAIVSKKKMIEIIKYIDEFTVSYHPENTEKQKQNFKDNLLLINNSGKRLKCIVLMPENVEDFIDSQDMILWLKDNNLKYLPRQLDRAKATPYRYNQQQVQWFNSLYQSKSFGSTASTISDNQEEYNLGDIGRACCGGRQMCSNQQYKNRDFYIVDNKFKNWYCSVNWFFLFVKQVNGEVYVNKDCKMNFEGEVGPIGHLSDTAAIVNNLRTRLEQQDLPIIQCKKYKCLCGLCAPKAEDFETYKKIIKKYQKDYQL